MRLPLPNIESLPNTELSLGSLQICRYDIVDVSKIPGLQTVAMNLKRRSL
jgi:hypothetical protein